MRVVCACRVCVSCVRVVCACRRHASAIELGFCVWWWKRAPDYAAYVTHDLSMLRLLEAFCESAPQLTLLLYIILQSGHAPPAQCASRLPATHLHLRTYTCSPTPAHLHLCTYTCSPTPVHLIAHLRTYTCVPTPAHLYLSTSLLTYTPTPANLHLLTYTCVPIPVHLTAHLQSWLKILAPLHFCQLMHQFSQRIVAVTNALVFTCLFILFALEKHKKSEKKANLI